MHAIALFHSLFSFARLVCIYVFLCVIIYVRLNFLPVDSE